MAQSGWRLPDDLLRRVRVRCAEEGVRQNAWVERALESALGDSRGPDRQAPNEGGPGLPSAPAPSRASEPYKLPPSKPAPKPAVVPSRAAQVPGVRPAREFVLDPRQARVNAGSGKKGKGS